MNPERLLAHYEKIADAPDVIPRLRRFVLDLAVRGELVPQDANDEPAAELLKRIAAEKARLVKAGEIRKPKPIPALPPLAEQRRIVAKVDALITLCDRLEASLTATAAARRRLLDALLAEALALANALQLEAAE